MLLHGETIIIHLHLCLYLSKVIDLDWEYAKWRIMEVSLRRNQMRLIYFLFFIFFRRGVLIFLKFIIMSYGPLLRYLLLNFSFVIYSYLMNLQNLLEVKSQLLVNLRWLEVFLKQQWRKLWLNRRIPSFRSQ